MWMYEWRAWPQTLLLPPPPPLPPPSSRQSLGGVMRRRRSHNQSLQLYSLTSALRCVRLVSGTFSFRNAEKLLTCGQLKIIDDGSEFVNQWLLDIHYANGAEAFYRATNQPHVLQSIYRFYHIINNQYSLRQITDQIIDWCLQLRGDAAGETF